MRRRSSSSKRRPRRSSGKSRRPKVVIPVSPIDILGPAGYTYSLPERERHAAMRRMLARHAYRDIIARMNAVAVRFRHTHPEISQIYRKDMAWLKRLHESQN